MEEKEGENGRLVLSRTTGAKFYLVSDFLWTASAIVGTNRDCGDVGVDRDDYEEALSLIKAGVLSAGAISVVG